MVIGVLVGCWGTRRALRSRRQVFTNYATSVWLYNALTVCFCVSVSLFLETFCFLFHLEQSLCVFTSLSLGIRVTAPLQVHHCYRGNQAWHVKSSWFWQCWWITILSVFCFTSQNRPQNVLRYSGPKKFLETLATPKSLFGETKSNSPNLFSKAYN